MGVREELIELQKGNGTLYAKLYAGDNSVERTYEIDDTSGPNHRILVENIFRLKEDMNDLMSDHINKYSS